MKLPRTLVLGSGLNRLCIVLTLGWVLYGAVVYSMQRQYYAQNEAMDRFREENKNCDELVKDLAPVDTAQECYTRASENMASALDDASFSRFWVWDVVFWRALIPIVLIPPVVLYVAALAVQWVWRGFKIPNDAD